MQKHGGTDPIDCKSCGCHIKTNNHLFRCPRQPQFLRRIQSIIDEVEDTLDPKLYHLLKHHLTTYIKGKDLLSITTLTLTHERKVPRPSFNLDTNPYVDFVPTRQSRYLHNPYTKETEYPYEENQ